MYCHGCYGYLSPQNSLPAAFAALDREHFAILCFMALKSKKQTYSISGKEKLHDIYVFLVFIWRHKKTKIQK